MSDETLAASTPEEIRPHGVNPKDPGLLLVRGSKDGIEDKIYVKKLAGAVLTVIQKYGYAHVKVIGAAALNNAVKACIIAFGEAKKKNINCSIEPGFDTAEIGGMTKTAIMLSVKAVAA